MKYKYLHPLFSMLIIMLMAPQALSAQAAGQRKTAKKEIKLSDMTFIKGGTFQMGSEYGTTDETPVHTVTLSDFYIGRFEVTFEEYDAYCAATGKTKPDDEGWGRGKRPAINVSWLDAVAYCNWRSEQEGYQSVYNIIGDQVSANWDANGYRLPTEAEWEFAARSRGGKDKWAGTNLKGELTKYCNYGESDDGDTDGYENTAPVGSFLANSSGLYDMSGNVWEWCWDWYDDKYYQSSPTRDPHGPGMGSSRVPRGGSWYSGPFLLRCTYRHNYSPDGRYNSIGFRLSRAAL